MKEIPRIVFAISVAAFHSAASPMPYRHRWLPWWGACVISSPLSKSLAQPRLPESRASINGTRSCWRSCKFS